MGDWSSALAAIAAQGTGGRANEIVSSSTSLEKNFEASCLAGTLHYILRKQ